MSKAARTFHWWAGKLRRHTIGREYQRYIDADRLWRVSMRAWCRRHYTAASFHPGRVTEEAR